MLILRTDTERELFVLIAFQHLNTPYIWGGDDPSGLDCSGFVIECLKSIGRVAEGFDDTADGLWKKYRHLEVMNPDFGRLVFWPGNLGKMRHMEICLTAAASENWVSIGASGGGRATDSEDDAWAANAYVKIRPVFGRPWASRVAGPRFVDIFNHERLIGTGRPA